MAELRSGQWRANDDGGQDGARSGRHRCYEAFVEQKLLEPYLRWPSRQPNAAPEAAATERRTRQVEDPIEIALAEIRFGPDSLVPAVVQQHDTGEILMHAWMNRDAVRTTLAEGRACYWSRSRQRLWRKGETSGQVQRLCELRLDCDGDALLLLVEQSGVACHTGRRSCFFRNWRDGRWEIITEPQASPETLYPKTETTG